jgi:septal ring factor EnvC (AmiA/AmiB activator)
MRLFDTAPAMLVLAVATVSAQTPTALPVPGGAAVLNQGHSLSARRGTPLNFGTNPGVAQTPATLHQRLQEMEATVAKMHAVLKQMRTKSASSARDPFVKANLEMWDLMVGQLDKQLQELQAATAARDALEARRASLYKQADAKAEAAAEAARKAAASANPGSTPVAVSADPKTSSQPVAGESTPAPTASSATSPN